MESPYVCQWIILTVCEELLIYIDIFNYFREHPSCARLINWHADNRVYYVIDENSSQAGYSEKRIFVTSYAKHVDFPKGLTSKANHHCLISSES